MIGKSQQTNARAAQLSTTQNNGATAVTTATLQQQGQAKNTASIHPSIHRFRYLAFKTLICSPPSPPARVPFSTCRW